MRYTSTSVKEFDSTNKKLIYSSRIVPTVEKSDLDEYVLTVSGDRLDLIAHEYYGDASLWWIIDAANPGITKGTLHLRPGLQLRIPTDPNRILLLEKSINKLR